METLASRNIDPAFIYYIYLREQALVGELASASPSAPEVESLLRMPGGPNGKPFYRPMKERGAGGKGEVLRESFWVAENVPGSWSPKSLKRLKGAGWLVNDANQYELPADHVARARKTLLNDVPVSAVAFGGYFLRNDGFVIDGDPSASDVVEGLRARFVFRAEHDLDFATLFDPTPPANVQFSWFESVGGANR